MAKRNGRKPMNAKSRKTRDKNFVAVTEKVFNVLEAFSQHPNSAITLEQVTQVAKLAKTTVHRLLYSMQKIGYVEKLEDSGKYLLSQRFFELGRDALPYQRLTSLARPFMNSLMQQFGESLHLGVLEDGMVVIITVCESQNAYRMAGVVGEVNYPHSTAMGKCLLAHLPEQELDKIVRVHGLPKKTAVTITNRAVLNDELEKVRREGVATNLGENIEGVTCVSSPIFNHQEKAIAALSISGPSIRMEQGLETIKKEIKRVALRLSGLLGYSPERPVNEVLATSYR
ncbi:MAG: IclR family transcriptional regulator [Acidobacteriota bacterium]